MIHYSELCVHCSLEVVITAKGTNSILMLIILDEMLDVKCSHTFGHVEHHTDFAPFQDQSVLRRNVGEGGGRSGGWCIVYRSGSSTRLGGPQYMLVSFHQLQSQNFNKLSIFLNWSIFMFWGNLYPPCWKIPANTRFRAGLSSIFDTSCWPWLVWGWSKLVSSWTQLIKLVD